MNTNGVPSYSITSKNPSGNAVQIGRGRCLAPADHKVAGKNPGAMVALGAALDAALAAAKAAVGRTKSATSARVESEPRGGVGMSADCALSQPPEPCRGCDRPLSSLLQAMSRLKVQLHLERNDDAAIDSSAASCAPPGSLRGSNNSSGAKGRLMYAPLGGGPLKDYEPAIISRCRKDSRSKIASVTIRNSVEGLRIKTADGDYGMLYWVRSRHADVGLSLQLTKFLLSIFVFLIGGNSRYAGPGNSCDDILQSELKSLTKAMLNQEWPHWIFRFSFGEVLDSGRDSSQGFTSHLVTPKSFLFQSLVPMVIFERSDTHDEPVVCEDHPRYSKHSRLLAIILIPLVCVLALVNCVLSMFFRFLSLPSVAIPMMIWCANNIYSHDLKSRTRVFEPIESFCAFLFIILNGASMSVAVYFAAVLVGVIAALIVALTILLLVLVGCWMTAMKLNCSDTVVDALAKRRGQAIAAGDERYAIILDCLNGYVRCFTLGEDSGGNPGFATSGAFASITPTSILAELSLLAANLISSGMHTLLETFCGENAEYHCDTAPDGSACHNASTIEGAVGDGRSSSLAISH